MAIRHRASTVGERPPVLSRDQVREFDRRASEELGIPGALLMENAGRNVANEVLELLRRDGRLDRKPPALVAVLCGAGNNGGDGYVVARHLANAGLSVEVFATSAELSGDALLNRRVAERMELAIASIATPEELRLHARAWSRADVLVDALLGTGFQGEVREPLARVIQAANAVPDARRVAVDVPSGLDCDTGIPSNATIEADLTVTFVAIKPGFQKPEARPFVGRLAVVDIGAPPWLAQGMGEECVSYGA